MQREIYVQMENNENRKFDRVRGAAAPRPRSSTAEQLEKLHDLVQQGALTQAAVRGREGEAARRREPPRRVVSLVPSVTETLLAWGIAPVACTRFCEQPDLPHVGGTKDPDVAAIVELAPDLVVMCDEENRREDADALAAAGVDVHACSPRSVADVAPALERAGRARSASTPPGRRRSPDLAPLGLRAFVPIWRRPWMTIGGGTYGVVAARRLGVDNVFAGADGPLPRGRPRRGARRAGPTSCSLRREPYPFRERHLAELDEVAPVAARRRPGPVLVGRAHAGGARPPAPRSPAQPR